MSWNLAAEAMTRQVETTPVEPPTHQAEARVSPSGGVNTPT